MKTGFFLIIFLFSLVVLDYQASFAQEANSTGQLEFTDKVTAEKESSESDLASENNLLREENARLDTELAKAQEELEKIRNFQSIEDIKTGLNFTEKVLDFLSRVIDTKSDLVPGIEQLRFEISVTQNTNDTEISGEKLRQIITKTQDLVTLALQDDTATQHKMIISNITSPEFGLMEIKKETNAAVTTINDPTFGIKRIFEKLNETHTDEISPPDDSNNNTVGLLIGVAGVIIGISVLLKQNIITKKFTKLQDAQKKSSLEIIVSFLEGNVNEIENVKDVIKTRQTNKTLDVYFMREILNAKFVGVSNYCDNIMMEMKFLRPHLEPSLYEKIIKTVAEIRTFNDPSKIVDLGDIDITVTKWLEEFDQLAKGIKDLKNDVQDVMDDKR